MNFAKNLCGSTVLYALALSTALTGCAHKVGAELPMTIEQCRQAKRCVIGGELSVAQIGGVTMGKLQLEGGSCVSASLPLAMIETLEKSGTRQTVLSGTIFPIPTDIEVASISVNQRKIGLGICGNFYLYVE